jgi:general stress protein CsbA
MEKRQPPPWLDRLLTYSEWVGGVLMIVVIVATIIRFAFL